MSQFFPIYRNGQVMTAPASGNAAAFALFVGAREVFNAVMIYNPGPAAVHVVSTSLDAENNPILTASEVSMIIPAGEKGVYGKKDVDTCLSLLSAGVEQYIYVYLGNGQ